MAHAPHTRPSCAARTLEDAVKRWAPSPGSHMRGARAPPPGRRSRACAGAGCSIPAGRPAEAPLEEGVSLCSGCDLRLFGSNAGLPMPDQARAARLVRSWPASLAGGFGYRLPRTFGCQPSAGCRPGGAFGLGCALLNPGSGVSSPCRDCLVKQKR